MKHTRIVLSLAWISVLILGLALTACSNGQGSPGDEIVYYEETKILTEAEAGNIEEVTENRTRILFRENTPFVASIEPGDILVSEHPVPGAEYGLLDRVTGVRTMGYGFLEGATGLANGGTVVEIEPATLEDVIEQGVISVNTTIPQEDLMSDTLWTTGVEVLQAEEGYEFSYSPIEGVTIEGHLLVTADAEIYIEAGFFSGLEEFKFIFSPGLEMEVDLTVDESVSWDEKYSIAEIPGPPIPIWGPVTVTPSIELVVGTDGEITGILEAGVAYERIYDVGIRYYNGTWRTINEIRGDGATLEPPSFSGQAEAKVYAGAVLSGTAGISYVAEAVLGTELLGNVRASGEIETSPWRWQYDLELYLTAQVFADLNLCRIAHAGWESDVWEYPDPPYNLAYGISGRVTEGELGLEGVEINFSGGHSSVTTDAEGYWSKHLLRGEVEVTPEKTGYVFDPPSMTITGSDSNLDFQALEGIEVTFPDPNLEAAIREAIGKPTGPIYTLDLQGLSFLNADDRNIIDLTGLEHCVNLVELGLSGNQINDISPLANLTNLQELYLYHNQISNISALTNLTNLIGLGLTSNQISDISHLANLSNMIGLWLSGNQIGNIASLANLTNLQWLHLDGNKISDISSLASLTNLDYIDLGENQIDDILPLANLTNLTEAYLYDNLISDISPLSDLTNLTLIWLDSNQIVDISPLVENEGLAEGDEVDLSWNPLSDDSINIYIPQLEARGVDVYY